MVFLSIYALCQILCFTFILQLCCLVTFVQWRVHPANVFLIPFKVPVLDKYKICQHAFELNVHIIHSCHSFSYTRLHAHTHTHTHTIMRLQPRDPCPSYRVNSYNFTITERDTDRLVISVLHTSNASLLVDSSQGLIANQVYLLTIEAMNTVGSTISEDILLCTWIVCIFYRSTNLLRGSGRGQFLLVVNLRVWGEHHLYCRFQDQTSAYLYMYFVHGFYMHVH